MIRPEDSRTDMLDYDRLIELRNHHRRFLHCNPGTVMEDWHGQPRAFPPVGFFLYRGEKRDYGTLRSNLFRWKDGVEPDVYELAVRKSRQIEFDRMLTESTVYKALMTEHRDTLWIGQHYGLETECIDLTSSIDVALFFATCTFESGSWRPLNHKEIRDWKHGVLYIRSMMDTTEERMRFMESLDVIGYTPLGRPSAQQGFLYRSDDGRDISGMFMKIRFEHSKRLSNEMFRIFNRGHALFPEGSSSPLSDICHRLRNSPDVHIPSYLESCRSLNVDGDEEDWLENIPPYYNQKFETDVLRADELNQLDQVLHSQNYILNNNIEFTTRLTHYD